MTFDDNRDGEPDPSLPPAGEHDPEPPGDPPGAEERPVFQHPQWMVGVVLVFGIAALVVGIDKPVWLLIGSPFILALLISLWARFNR
jgi:hypothetical protein